MFSFSVIVSEELSESQRRRCFTTILLQFYSPSGAARPGLFTRNFDKQNFHNFTRIFKLRFSLPFSRISNGKIWTGKFYGAFKADKRIFKMIYLS